MIASGVSSGINTSSSSLQGAVGSLNTQTAANIGFANSAFAAQKSISNTLLQGQLKAQKFRNIAAGFDTVAQLGKGYLSYSSYSGGESPPKFNKTGLPINTSGG